MKTKLKLRTLAQLLIIVLPFVTFAQISGNQIYNNNNNRQNNSYTQNTKIAVTANVSELALSAAVMINVAPDALVVTFGLNQEAKTVEECNRLINNRIEGFLQKTRKLGIKKDDSYVDFISQTRVYDYDVADTKITQFENGFEIKKNIIIKLKDITAFDTLTTLASGYEIYDIVKAEYIKEDTEAINDMLFEEALKIVKNKRKRHVKAFNAIVDKHPLTVDYNFYSMMPKNQYKEYKAFESSDINVYNYKNRKNYVQKEKRKNHTFYYQGLDAASFDKVINPAVPQVGLQYVVEVKVVYHIKR
ncbi:SIMPL domain-containing protein [Flavobacterium litorale]|uniref:SIMPL domain-containing protein n=1 Tax=Flavobacterium litorale TaxID=2856519 RepID=A0ABX8V355_9FLAO|nr:SIMPL domain-containing protein [Flavobacterium litorale]QYJ67278.1 SIMPL domain-containing protein [Flavobacterium litorale]